jgi:hypothetical protein
MNIRLKQNIDPFFSYYNSNLIANYQLLNHIITTFNSPEHIKELERLEEDIKKTGYTQRSSTEVGGN